MARKKNVTRDDGRISVQVYIGRDEKNRRKYKTVYGYTQKEADDKALQVKLAMKKGIDVTAELDSFSEWADRWEKVKITEVSAGQMAAYKSAVKYLKAAIGYVPISKVKAIDIQEVINSLAIKNPTTKKPSAKKTLLNVKITASQIFQMAIENRVLDYNPVGAVKIPSNAPAETRRALTQEEQRWILETEHDAKPAAMIMMYAGLRRGELISLLWSDIDIQRKAITVNKSAEKVSGMFIAKNTTKSVAGIRTVNIPQRLADYLMALPKKGLFVCCRADGSMHTESSWRSLWNSYLTDLNLKYGDFSFYEEERERKLKSKYDPEGVPMLIPHITPHMLRHTFATMLYFAGVDVLTARDQLGHSDIQTTLNIYTHLDNIYKQKQMDKLDAFLSDASQMQVSKS